MQAIGTYIKNSVTSWTIALSGSMKTSGSPVLENCAKDFVQKFFPSSAGQMFRSIGECLTRLTSFDSKLIFIDAPRYIGKAVQGGYDRKADGFGAVRYWAGSAFVGFGNTCNVPVGMAQSLADLGAETMKRFARVSPYIFAPGQTVVSKTVSALSKASQHPDIKKRADVFTPFAEAIKSDLVSRKPALVKLDAGTDQKKMKVYSALLHNLVPDLPDRQKDQNPLTKPSFRKETGDYQPAKPDQIPQKILARTDQNNVADSGSLLQMRIRSADTSGRLTILDGGRGSGLCVSVSILQGNDGQAGSAKVKDKVILAFAGTFQTAMWLTDGATVLGIKDQAYTDASRLVKAFKEQHPDKDVELVGYSLGGSLAQYAGIKHGVKVTTFNSYGLNLTQRNKLAALKQARAEKFRTAIDAIHQRKNAANFSLTDNEKKILRYANGDVTSIISHNDKLIASSEALSTLSSMANRVEVLPKVTDSGGGHTDINNDLLKLTERI